MEKDIIKSEIEEGVYYIMNPNNDPVYVGFINIARDELYLNKTAYLNKEELKKILKILEQ